ncbi:MAG: TrbC/VirB2 family protein [Parvularculaceae bacterium]
MIASNLHRLLIMMALIAIGSMLFVSPAHAAGSGMPWEAPLASILASIEGPVARIVAVIIIIIPGSALPLATRRAASAVSSRSFSVSSIAFAATSFFLAFFSFGGGAPI